MCSASMKFESDDSEDGLKPMVQLAVIGFDSRRSLLQDSVMDLQFLTQQIPKASKRLFTDIEKVMSYAVKVVVYVG